MKKSNLFSKALRGSPVHINDQIAIIEDFIYQKKGQKITVSHPNSYLQRGNDVFSFKREMQLVHDAFTCICIVAVNGGYEYDG